MPQWIIVSKTPNELSPHKRNPRKVKTEQIERLKKRIQSQGFRTPPTLTHDGVILAGHQRIKALIDLGLGNEPIDCQIPTEPLTKELYDEILAPDNLSVGDWDIGVLLEDFERDVLESWGFDFLPALKQQEPDLNEDPDYVPDSAQTRCKAGDLWILGQHRLLCGDSTSADDVSRLLDGEKPFLMVTDPPYGVEYNADWRNHSCRPDGSKMTARAIGKVKNDDNADWSEAWALSPSKVAYVYHAGLFSGVVHRSLEANDYDIRAQIIWAKNNLAISRGAYHWKHEPCWYAVKKGPNAQWAGDRKQTTVWEIDKPLKSETGHSTQKPVECMRRAIANHKGDVYEPFAGSGATLIAAHLENRRCFAIEIDAKYCDIILQRFEDLTGEKAELWTMD